MDTRFRWIFFRLILHRMKPTEPGPCRTRPDCPNGDIMRILLRIFLFIVSIVLGIFLILALIFFALLAYCALSAPHHFKGNPIGGNLLAEFLFNTAGYSILQKCPRVPNQHGPNLREINFSGWIISPLPPTYRQRNPAASAVARDASALSFDDLDWPIARGSTRIRRK